MNDKLPKFSKNMRIGDKGLRIVNDIICDELDWIFRDQPVNDLGIDAYIEIVDEKSQGTGKLIALQIKCGESYFEEIKEDGFLFRDNIQHLNYWLNYSLPVILIICNPNTKKCFWTEVSNSNTLKTTEQWKVLIPFDNHFDSRCKSNLEEIAYRPRHSEIARLLLAEFLYDRYGSRIEICPNTDLPRDFHGSA